MADNKQIMKYVGIGCGAVLLLSCCIGGVGMYACDNALSGPADAAKGFFVDMREGRPEAALARMDGAYQNSHDLSTFQQATSAIPAITSQTDTTFNNRQINNSTGVVSGHLTTPMGDQPVQVTLTKVGDFWYINSIVVANVPLQ